MLNHTHFIATQNSIKKKRKSAEVVIGNVGWNMFVKYDIPVVSNLR